MKQQWVVVERASPEGDTETAIERQRLQRCETPPPNTLLAATGGFASACCGPDQTSAIVVTTPYVVGANNRTRVNDATETETPSTVSRSTSAVDIKPLYGERNTSSRKNRCETGSA